MISPLQALNIGDKAPDFSLPNQDNAQIALSSYKGHYIVLYFYPKDNTPGCTKQACSIQANWDVFTKQGITVLGISYDSPKSHKQFSKKYNLRFNLLSDSNKKVAKLYGACRYALGFMPMPFPRRKTFIIDPSGTIIDIIDNVDVGTHTYLALDIIKKDKKIGHKK